MMDRRNKTAMESVICWNLGICVVFRVDAFFFFLFSGRTRLPSVCVGRECLMSAIVRDVVSSRWVCFVLLPSSGVLMGAGGGGHEPSMQSPRSSGDGMGCGIIILLHAHTAL